MSKPFILSASVGEAQVAVPANGQKILQAAEAAGLDLLMFGRPDERPFDAQVVVAWAAPLSSTVGLVATVPASNAHPFHVARALSAADFLSNGRIGWSVIPEGAPDGMAEDMVSAARALWDGWASDTLVIDKASGHYLDSDKVRAPNYSGPFFKVAGPLNAMRPPLGHPILIVDQQAPLALGDADIALVAEPVRAGGATRTLLKCAIDADAAELKALFEGGQVDGAHFALSDPLVELPQIAARFATLASIGERAPGNLRQRLNLPIPRGASNQADGAHTLEYVA